MKNNQQKIPEGWKNEKLGNISDICRGGSPRPITEYLTKDIDGINWLRIGDIDIDSKYIYKTSEKIKKEGLNKTTLVKEGDFILSNSMSFGRPYIMKTKSCIHDGWLALRNIKNNINQDFLYYLLLTEKSQYLLKTLAAGSGVQNLKKETVSTVELLFPPLLEQNRIVSVLETWNKYLENLDQKIKIKKNIKKYLAKELLNENIRLEGFNEEWKTVKISDIGQIVTGNTPPMNDTNNYGDEYCWATADDFNGKYISNTKIKLSEKGKNISRYLPAGSILVTCIASIGKNAIAEIPLATNQQINSIIVNNKNSNEFIYYLINISKNLLKKYAGVGTIPILNKVNFSNIKIRIPSDIQEQTAIANILIKADQEISTLEKQREIIRAQKKYLLNNLITGQIRLPEFVKKAETI